MSLVPGDTSLIGAGAPQSRSASYGDDAGTVWFYRDSTAASRAIQGVVAALEGAERFALPPPPAIASVGTQEPMVRRLSSLEGSGFEPSVPLPRLSSIRAVRAEIIGRVRMSFGETESSMSLPSREDSPPK